MILGSNEFSLYRCNHTYRYIIHILGWYIGDTWASFLMDFVSLTYHQWELCKLPTATSAPWEVLDGSESEALKVFFEKKNKTTLATHKWDHGVHFFFYDATFFLVKKKVYFPTSGPAKSMKFPKFTQNLGSWVESLLPLCWR